MNTAFIVFSSKTLLFCKSIYRGLGVCWFSMDIMGSSSSKSKYAKMPKVELHVHADGACRLSTLRDLSQKFGLSYPHDDLEKFRRVVSLPNAVPSLKDFLSVFKAITDILRNKEALERIAYEFCEDSAKQNVVYAELRFNPLLSVPHCSGEDYCEGIFTGLEKGHKDFGIKVRCILCFGREHPDDVMNVVKLAERYKGQVVGVDMSGDELKPLHQNHLAGFQRARELGLHVTVHAAESGPAENVREAIEKLGAERIGHGYHVLDDLKVYELAKARGVHFEACPTSSVFTNSSRFEDHALQSFVKDDVSFSLSTDDPGVMNCDLIGEYDVAESKVGLSKEQLMRSVVCAAEASFLPPSEKEELVKEIKEKLIKFDPTFSDM